MMVGQAAGDVIQGSAVIHSMTEEEVLAKYDSRIRDWARRMDYSLRDDLAQAARIKLLEVWRAKGDTANDAYLRGTITCAMMDMMQGERLRRRIVMNEEMMPPEMSAPSSSESSVELAEALAEYSPFEVDVAMASAGGYGIKDISRMFRTRRDRVSAVLKKIRRSCVQPEK